MKWNSPKRWTNFDYVISYAHTSSALNAGAKRSDVPYGHVSMLLLGEGSEATEPYNKYANLFKLYPENIRCYGILSTIWIG